MLAASTAANVLPWLFTPEPAGPFWASWDVWGGFRFGPRELFWLCLALLIIWLSTRGKRGPHLSRRPRGGRSESGPSGTPPG